MMIHEYYQNQQIMKWEYNTGAKQNTSDTAHIFDIVWGVFGITEHHVIGLFV